MVSHAFVLMLTKIALMAMMIGVIFTILRTIIMTDIVVILLVTQSLLLSRLSV